MSVEPTTSEGVRQPFPSEGARPFGPAAAVMLAAAAGVFILGLLTTLAEASTGIKDALQWSDRVGPLSGKTIIAAAVFFAGWALLGTVLRTAEPPWKKVVYGTGALIALGFLMTFPTFFQAFVPE
ncbi:MAG TPA: hypothetical protein VGJ34_07600 [Gaiellaceae bacterium]|jgi:hypothetical protein